MLTQSELDKSRSEATKRMADVRSRNLRLQTEAATWKQSATDLEAAVRRLEAEVDETKERESNTLRELESQGLE